MGTFPSHPKSHFRALLFQLESVSNNKSLPVDHVSWFDCIRFCNALSIAEDLEPVYSIGSGDQPTVSLDLDRSGYRLPTEAEWEYASKAGTELTYAGSNKVDEVAWYNGSSGLHIHPVGQKKPNAWGLYDCSGNVLEWCSDQLNDTAYQCRTGTTHDPHEWVGSASPRVHRGGNYLLAADCCRVAYRSSSDANFHGDGLGFRILRSYTRQ